jgi:hypothetical protein
MKIGGDGKICSDWFFSQFTHSKDTHRTLVTNYSVFKLSDYIVPFSL